MIFQNLVSWSLLVGFVIGFVANRLLVLLRECWGRRTSARAKWEAVKVDPRAMAAVVLVLFVGWSVYQTQANTNGQAQAAADAKAFAVRVQDCQARLIAAIIEGRRLTAENDRLSREERGKLADLARYQAEWIGRLLDPPPEVKKLPTSDPVRERYGLDVTRGFFNRAAEINARIKEIHDEQNQNDRIRPELPDPSCGER